MYFMETDRRLSFERGNSNERWKTADTQYSYNPIGQR